MSDPLLGKKYSVDGFIDTRVDLPDMGQWAELHEGSVALLEVPDEIHGRIVFNLSKAIAAFMQESDVSICPCFDIGLVMSSKPGTVWFPAMSVFQGSRFSHTDDSHTLDTPELVVEIASTRSRRNKLRSRILSYHERGVSTVWAVDPDEQHVNILERGKQTRKLRDKHELLGEGVMSNFSVAVSALFAQPDWYR